jgi:RsiW-degrading membrane proteinase PrsW (M82 family)
VTLFYSIVLALATFIWGWIFYKKEYHPQPLKVIALSFVAGALSMIPVFGYKYVYVHFLPELSEVRILRPLLDSAILSGLIYFLINMFIVIAILTTLAGLMTLILSLFKHETLQNIKNSLKDDEFEYVTMSSMIALLIFGERLLEEFFNVTIIHTMIGVIMFLAIIEEYVKHLTVRFIDDKKIKDVDDAITLSIVVGLAFAFIETILYAITIGDIAILLPRALLTMSIHVIASGIFGYYYGLARFASPIMKAERKEKKYQIKFKWLHTALRMKKSEVYEEEKTAQGLVMATLFHTIANVLFELNYAFVTVPLIVLGLTALSYYYKESHVICRLLHKR